MVAPYDGDTFVFSSFSDRSADIPLTNLGVLVVPDARAQPAFPISHGHIQNDATRTGEHVHQTFNHRNPEILSHMPECTHAPESWASAVRNVDCHGCLEANAHRVPVKGHVPDVQAPGDLMSMDGYENATPHIHGGQRQVLGTYDAYSHLDRSYIMHSKSDAAACIESHLAWNNSLGIRYRRCHTDNAPDLCKGDAAATFRRWGVQVTTSAAWEPRQNGQMERRWRQHGEDSRVALGVANFIGTGAVSPSAGEKFWWYAWRDAEIKSWSIPFKKNGVWTCPWLLHTGHRPNPTVHRPFGMLCYAKQYHPQSKTSTRGRECRVLGYSLTQKAWILLEVPTGKTFTSPHVHFCWGVFPGLRPYKAGGGADFPASPQPPPPGPQSGAGMPDGTTQAPPPPPPDPPHQGPPPPPMSPDSPSDDGSDDDGQGGDGGAVQGGNGGNVPISQRLRRVSRRPYDPYTEQGGGSHPHPGSNRSSAPVNTAAASRGSTTVDVDSDLQFGDKYEAAVRAVDSSIDLPPQSTKLEVPDGVKFVLYLCAGKSVGEGTIAFFLRMAGIYTVMVDVKQGGYSHDLTHAPIQRQVLELAARPQCLGCLSSVPCGSYSVLRYVAQANAPGVERRRPHHTRGIPRADGSLAPSVVRGNTLLDFSVLVSTTVISHGGFAFYESPVSRAEDSQFAIRGREDHAAMWDDPGLQEHMTFGRYQWLAFDQCCTRPHPSPQKTTQLAATPGLFEALFVRFAHRRCTLPIARHSSMPGGADEDGAFRSEEESRYSVEMNELIAESVVEAIEQGLPPANGPFPSDVVAGKPPTINLTQNVQRGDGRNVQGGVGGKVQGGDGSESTLADRELKRFNDAGYTIKLHPPDYFLGCNVEPGATPHQVSISMKAYVTQLATKYLPKPLDAYPLYHVPATKDLFASYEKAMQRKDTLPSERQKEYASKVGAMIFAAPAARFDCAYGIGVCARCLTFPTEEMDQHADRIIAYMAQHADDALQFDGTAPGADIFSVYSDSDWAVGHSTTGWCATYGNATVGYGSKRQQSVALSSTEAEIMAASLAACEIVFMRGLLREMGVKLDGPTLLRVDNLGAVALAKDRRSCHRSRHIQRRYLKVREFVALGEVKVEYVNTDANAADILTKALERDAFERHCGTLSGATRPVPVASMCFEDPLAAWEQFYAEPNLLFVDNVSEPMTPLSAEASALAQLDRAQYALVRALARTAGTNFTQQLAATPYGVLDDVLLTAVPRENDDPTLREAAASADRAEWQDACDAEHENLASHDAFEYVPEDSLPSWNPRTNRAREVCDTLWVLKQKRDGKNKKTKKKGRICFNGAMQKATAAHNGTVVETFAPTVRHTTFKLLAAHGAVAGRRCRQFDVEGAYLKGKFENEEVIYARPPPNFPGGTVYRLVDEREVPLVWRLKVPLYGEADAGRIWNRTAVNQLVNVQGFTQSEFDPCYFFKEQGGERVDIALYVDDGYVLG